MGEWSISIEDALNRHRSEIMQIPNARYIAIGARDGKQKIIVFISAVQPGIDAVIESMKGKLEGYELVAELHHVPGPS